MSTFHDHDHGHDEGHGSPRTGGEALSDEAAQRKVLWIALALNLAMFFIEAAVGLRAQSTSLLADAIDFIGDAASYAVSLAVLGAALTWRARTALLKSAFMIGFGLFVLGRAWWSYSHAIVPDSVPMGAVSVLALGVNLYVAWILYAHRNGDANMKSVWVCSRNDAFGNLAVMGAAVLVGWLQHGWPDLLVALLMAGMAVQGGWSVMRRAALELKQGP